ncbi:hypothetical protein [Saccharopolyspora sp. NPDC049357]|uniref:hypothetical protein n=1 Tax=Saccharopolyspora sp. NPDC049357 TaxID=3154507 RepID=UPI003441EEC3
MELIVRRARKHWHCERGSFLLALAGKSNMDLSRELLVLPPTMTKWRRRFVSHRLDGLSDEPKFVMRMKDRRWFVAVDVVIGQIQAPG